MATRIYIDQGHNPVNPNAGAEGNGLREQDIVFNIGLALAELLRRAGYEVRLSRPTADTQLGDSTLSSLQARVNDANSWGANYFVSLHTNSSSSPQATGIEAFSFATGTAGFTLAQSIANALSEVTGLPNRGVFARPSLYVLRRTAMPAALIELGFITNPGDAALLNENPGLFAQGIFQGIARVTGP